MFKLAPLSAAIVLGLAGQAMADDSVSTQSQLGTENIAEVRQLAAPNSSSTQQQTGLGNNAASLQDNSTAQIHQQHLGEYNAGYAEQ